MRARNMVVLALFAALATLQLGCASSTAPRGWLPSAREAQREAYGGWMDMEVLGPGVTLPVRGELLAISADSVFTVSGDTVRAVALTSVVRARLETYDPNYTPVAAVTLMAALASSALGELWILAAPMCLVGAATSAVVSRGGKHRIDAHLSAEDTSSDRSAAIRESWRRLRLYARFPQGMPAGLDRALLRERPLAIRAKLKESSPGSISE